MTTALKYKSIGDWDRMIGEIKIAYNPYFFDIDNTSTPLYWYYGLAHFNKGEVNIAFDYFKKDHADLMVPVFKEAFANTGTSYISTENKMRFGDYLDIIANKPSLLRMFLFNIFKSSSLNSPFLG